MNTDYISNVLDYFLNKYLALNQDINDMENLYKKTIKEVERLLINKVMKFTNFNKSRSARILGISRNTLDTKLNLLKPLKKSRCLVRKKSLEN